LWLFFLLLLAGPLVLLVLCCWPFPAAEVLLLAPLLQQTRHSIEQWILDKLEDLPQSPA
jgi:hypothetical protein